MPRRKPDPVKTELPMQAPVEEPILNSPYYEAVEHWVYGQVGHSRRWAPTC